MIAFIDTYRDQFRGRAHLLHFAGSNPRIFHLAGLSSSA